MAGSVGTLALRPARRAAILWPMNARPKRSRTAPASTRRAVRVAVLAFPDVQVLVVMGPLEVFSRTSRWLRDHGQRSEHVYAGEIVGLKRGVFRTSSGLRLHADHAIADV